MRKKRDTLNEKVELDQAYKDFHELAKARGFTVHVGQGKTTRMLMALSKSFEKYYGEIPKIERVCDYARNGRYFDEILYLRNSTGTVELFLKERYTREVN